MNCKKPVKDEKAVIESPRTVSAFTPDPFMPLVQAIEPLLKACLMTALPQQHWIACSGGADSLALALAFQETLKGQLIRTVQPPPIRWGLIHIDHGLRASSAQEAQWVQRWADAHHCPISVVKPSTASDSSADQGQWTETQARAIRYQAFEACFKAGQAEGDQVYIWLAHHATDQVETVLLNWTRGAGLTGLCGMPTRQPSQTFKAGFYMRPFLSLEPSQLRTVLKVRQETWLEDESNHALCHRRNALRHQVLPALQKVVDPGAIERMSGVVTRLQALRQTCLDLVDWEQLWAEFPHCMQRKPFLTYPRELQILILQEAFAAALQTTNTTVRQSWGSQRLFDALLEGIAQASGDKLKSFDLGAGLTLKVDANYLYWPGADLLKWRLPGDWLLATHIALPQALPEVGFVKALQKRGQLSLRLIEGQPTIQYNQTVWTLSRLPKPSACLRLRQPGDWVRRQDGRKQSLKLRWSNLRIPAEYRDLIVVLAEGNEVLWPIHLPSTRTRRQDG